ncbi:sulfotransferase [Acuticoccus sediminis]|uniref:Sulfotransferase n=1 Tax=Acuticoccus sediminis TaxID=2184697 RepID=A0A8B2NLV3_9HYPH|nr:sulfotransferase [Acuticoccus sediminis]RAH98794.1 sulfotransferase [Acuticoccus sediminis]
MADCNSWSGPLFIVGASRSGTAMMRSILNRQPLIGLATETHYFDDLRVRPSFRKAEALSPEQAAICADYFRSIDDRPYGMQGDPSRSALSREELFRRSEAAGGGADGIFEAYCRFVAEREGKTIWGEKTPRHVFRLNDILTAFPSAKVVCMVRDPRAVVASYRDWRNQGGLNVNDEEDYQAAIAAEERRAKLSYNIVISTLLWCGTVNAAVGALTRHGSDRVRIVRYEDVTDQPSVTVSSLCDWLGIGFDETMMDVPMHNSSVLPFAKSAGVSRAAVDRWRKTLSDHEVDVIQTIAGKCLIDAGYQKADVKRDRIGRVREYADLPIAVARAMLANRKRMGNVVFYSWRRLKAAAVR